MNRRARVAYISFAVIVLASAVLAAVVLCGSTSVGILSSFSTDLAPRSMQQRHNITRAASKIDGLIVRPGEEFSFNKSVGICGLEQGYQRAPAIVDGEMRPEWGGGVCQVTSTLYNAVLLAGLRVTERHSHSRRVSSVPPGRDAVTAFGVADLRFVNTTGAPIRIRTAYSSVRLAISILGKPTNSARVEIVTESRGCAPRRDSSVAGKAVLTYRVTYTASGDSRRELLSSDVYPPSAEMR